MKRYALANMFAAIGIMLIVWALATIGFGSWCAQADYCDEKLFNRVVLYLFAPVSVVAGITAVILQTSRHDGRKTPR